MVSTAAKHTKPHRKQAVSHPPTKTPQHSKTRQQDSGLPNQPNNSPPQTQDSRAREPHDF
ncbi:hypothetical protein DIJ64_06475 [Mycobacterium leprae]|uniref:Uncharacterized protein n=1 Tax=Mycobacterium leprae TaxID=1769 RepID=A0AAD0P4U7_MYCLR|nr:hypothetical protein DIJ64_06475 [Mycobacterium leprae]